MADRVLRGLTANRRLFRASPTVEGQAGARSVVGVSDEITFEVPITLSLENIAKEDPCEVAAMVAGLALKTMKNC